MTGSQRHGWAVWAAMAILFFAGVDRGLLGRGPRQSAAARRRSARDRACKPGGNMEGKEVRFGIANSALFATVTTDASCGAINGWHDSFTPLGGMVPLVNIMLSEVIFGGVGAGMYGMSDLHRARGVHRRPDGGPHAGVSGQEDRSLRREDGDAGGAGLPAGHSGVHGDLVGERFRHLQHSESRTARVHRDSLRLHVAGRQQRLGLWRADCQHALVQHRAAASPC